MALKKLPKWAIKQAGGINKKAWRLARRGRGKGGRKFKRRAKKVVRRRKKGKLTKFRKPMGIVGKINAGLKALRLGLPAIGEVTTHGIGARTLPSLVERYAAFDIENGKFNADKAIVSAGFYGGVIAESKVMSLLKTPQMAGKKKLAAIAAQFLPELLALPHVMQGDFRGAATRIGRSGIGYSPPNHQAWTQNTTVRNEWITAMTGRVGLSLFSRFVGPMVNKFLPKGVNI